MGLFNNKELEALQTENDRLRDKITTLEVRLSAKDKAIADMRDEIVNLESQADEYRSVIEKYKTSAANFIPFHEVEKIKRELYGEIQALKSELARPQICTHNERGAGRKRKATQEQVNYILSLHADGCSQMKIAKILTEQSGGKWNKSTVRNIIIAAKS